MRNSRVMSAFRHAAHFNIIKLQATLISSHLQLLFFCFSKEMCFLISPTATCSSRRSKVIAVNERSKSWEFFYVWHFFCLFSITSSSFFSSKSVSGSSNGIVIIIILTRHFYCILKCFLPDLHNIMVKNDECLDGDVMALANFEFWDTSL